MSYKYKDSLLLQLLTLRILKDKKHNNNLTLKVENKGKLNTNNCDYFINILNLKYFSLTLTIFFNRKNKEKLDIYNQLFLIQRIS